MKKSLSTLLLVCFTLELHTKMVVGDPDAATNTTFSFNVGFAQYDSRTQDSFAGWWTMANDPNIGSLSDDAKKYGLSFIQQTVPYISKAEYQITAIPLLENKNITINSFNGTNVIQTSLPNPLWGASAQLFDVTEHRPTFTLASALNFFYLINDANISVRNTISEMLVYDAGAGEEIKTLKSQLDSFFIAHSNGSFGANPSTLTIVQKATGTTADKQSAQYLKKLADLVLTISTEGFVGGTSQPSLTSFGPSVSIQSAFGAMYLLPEVTSSAGGIGLGIAKITTKVESNTFVINLDQLAPTSIFTGGFDTVISAQNGNAIRISHIAEMSTSTTLPYLIVAQDNGTGPETIYALPVTPSGEIADFTSATTAYGSIQPIFVARGFASTITDGNQINPANPDVALQLKVGSNTNLPLDAGNNISDLYVVGDCVYIVISSQYTATQAPGTYRSQALFAQDGHIVGWTPWSRVLGSDAQQNYSFVDGQSLVGLYIKAATPSATPTFNTIIQTTFDAQTNLTPFLTPASSVTGGIQGLFDFDQSTPGFNNELSLMIATGKSSVTIGQTGALDTGIFKVKTMSSSDVLSFNNATINNHEALICAEIAHSGNNHWIFVGGSSGVSVYTYDNEGVSWSGNLNSIGCLTCDQTWKKIGNFTFVKKIVWDMSYIYIMTSTHIYQIELDPAKFAINPTPLNSSVFLQATEIDSNAYFLDMIIDNGFCIIGTTKGLYTLSPDLKPVLIPQGLPAVSKIISFSKDKQAQRSFKELSNIYILDNTFGTEQARLHRFTMQDGNMHSFNDAFAAQSGSISQGMLSAFIIFNTYISTYFTDGTWNIAGLYFTGFNAYKTTPSVMQIKSGVRSGQSSSQTILPRLTSTVELPFIKNGTNILGMIRESTSGALIVAGDFQAHTNA